MSQAAANIDLTLFDGIALFEALSPAERADLAAQIRVRDLPANEVLFWIGDAGADFYVIRDGKIKITYPDESGQEVTLATLESGDFLGEISLLDGGPRTATARAQTSATLLSLGRADFLGFIGRYPSAAVHMMSVLGRRQRESVEQLRGIRNLNEVMDEQLTRWQRISHAIAAMAGSPYFLAANILIFSAWMILNLALHSRAPDPFPFSLLCLWTSCEAIFLSMFIMISQNLQAQKDRLRTEMEYQVALKAQFEIMQLHRKLDALSEQITREP